MRFPVERLVTGRMRLGRPHIVPLLVGFLVFLGFAALGIHRANERHVFGTDWTSVEATVEDVAELPQQGGQQITLRYEHSGVAHSALMGAPDAPGKASVAPGSTLSVLVDPNDPGRTDWPPGRADLHALGWTAAFGLLAGVITFAIGASAMAANGDLPAGGPQQPATGKPAPSLPAQVANGFGLALLGIGSAFALAALWAAIADGSWVGAQGAVITFAAAVGLWRICKWLAEKIFS
jgi:hypothetical protein